MARESASFGVVRSFPRLTPFCKLLDLGHTLQRQRPCLDETPAFRKLVYLLRGERLEGRREDVEPVEMQPGQLGRVGEDVFLEGIVA